MAKAAGRESLTGRRRQARETAPVNPSSSPAAKRMRAVRQRRRMGMTTLRIGLHVTQIHGLIRKGYLGAEDRDNLPALEWAIDSLIETVLNDKT